MIEFYDELFILFVKIKPVVWAILTWYLLLPFSIGHSLFAPTVELLLAFFFLFHFLSFVCFILRCIMGGRWIKDFLLALALDSKLFSNRLLIIEVKIVSFSSKWGHAKLTAIIAFNRTWCRLAKMLRQYLLKALGVIIVFEFLDSRGHFLKTCQTMTQEWITQLYIQTTTVTSYFSACFALQYLCSKVKRVKSR